MKKNLRPIVLGAFIAWLLVGAAGCSIRLADGNEYAFGDFRRNALTELEAEQKDVKVRFVHHGPFPLLAEPKIVLDIERDGDKVTVHIETGTKTKEAASAYTQWVSAFFGFLGGLFVAR